MKITKVEPILLSYPFEKPVNLAYFGGDRVITKRDAMLIRVSTDKGLTGWAPGEASEKAKQTIETVIAPFLTGRTVADPDALRVIFLQSHATNAEIAKIYCSVEIALYDLLGKAHDVLLHRHHGLGCA